MKEIDQVISTLSVFHRRDIAIGAKELSKNRTLKSWSWFSRRVGAVRLSASSMADIFGEEQCTARDRYELDIEDVNYIDCEVFMSHEDDRS